MVDSAPPDPCSVYCIVASPVVLAIALFGSGTYGERVRSGIAQFKISASPFSAATIPDLSRD